MTFGGCQGHHDIVYQPHGEASVLTESHLARGFQCGTRAPSALILLSESWTLQITAFIRDTFQEDIRRMAARPPRILEVALQLAADIVFSLWKKRKKGRKPRLQLLLHSASTTDTKLASRQHQSVARESSRAERGRQLGHRLRNDMEPRPSQLPSRQLQL